MVSEVAVYKLQERDMGDSEKKYSQIGNLEAHYYFAKNNDGKVLFTTTSNLIRKKVDYVLLTLPDGKHGFLARIIEMGAYHDNEVPKDSSYTVPTQWQDINKEIEQKSKFNWIALKVVSKIISDIENIPNKPSPQYIHKEELTKFIDSI